MSTVKCQLCREEINGGVKIQYFDFKEPTTIHIFCSENCRTKWISAQGKEKRYIG